VLAQALDRARADAGIVDQLVDARLAHRDERDLGAREHAVEQHEREDDEHFVENGDLGAGYAVRATR
jgi:hypothetical protein